MELVGVGLYTPAEAARLLHVPAPKISRWLRGHRAHGRDYEPLWRPQVDLDDGRIFLGFRDLMEVRIADKFINEGLSAQRVRSAIQLARTLIGGDRPLSTDRFRTDGREIFLRVVETDEHGEERERLLNLFRRQYEFKQIIEPLLRTIGFDAKGVPSLWWPLGKRGNIVVDPARSFGQPIDAETRVPTKVLASAGQYQGIPDAARAYEVPEAAVRRAMEFEAGLVQAAA
jgi:uncharacterized protein (DUF433 family)